MEGRISIPIVGMKAAMRQFYEQGAKLRTAPVRCEQVDGIPQQQLYYFHMHSCQGRDEYYVSLSRQFL